MSSDDEVAKLEAQLQKAKAKRAAQKAAEEQQIAKEKAAAEAKRIAEEKVATEAKRIAEEKAAAAARQVEEWRRAELEEQQREMAMAKAREEAKGCWIAKGLVAAVAKCKAFLAAAETVVEEAEMEQAIGLSAKQKGRAEGERLACDRCATRGFDCQVSLVKKFGIF